MTCFAATGLMSFGRRLARRRPTALRSGSCARRARNVSTGYWILNRQHLDRILEVFVNHYNEHRPHRALSLAPPELSRSDASLSTLHDARIPRRDPLGGVVTSASEPRHSVFAPFRRRSGGHPRSIRNECIEPRGERVCGHHRKRSRLAWNALNEPCLYVVKSPATWPDRASR